MRIEIPGRRKKCERWNKKEKCNPTSSVRSGTGVHNYGPTQKRKFYAPQKRKKSEESTFLYGGKRNLTRSFSILFIASSSSLVPFSEREKGETRGKTYKGPFFLFEKSHSWSCWNGRGQAHSTKRKDNQKQEKKDKDKEKLDFICRLSSFFLFSRIFLLSSFDVPLDHIWFDSTTIFRFDGTSSALGQLLPLAGIDRRVQRKKRKWSKKKKEKEGGREPVRWYRVLSIRLPYTTQHSHTQHQGAAVRRYACNNRKPLRRQSPISNRNTWNSRPP